MLNKTTNQTIAAQTKSTTELKVKQLIGAALLAVSLSQPGLARETLKQSPQATVFVKKGGGFFGVPPPWKFNKAGRDAVNMYQFANNATSDVRLEQLARLQTAAYALQNGYSYFSFSPTKHYLVCNSLFTGEAMATPLINAKVKLAREPRDGFESAKNVMKEFMPILSADASDAEKSASFQLWTSSCAPKIKPGFKNLFKKPSFDGVTVNDTVFEIQR
jgi:hypothetical protein